MLTNLAECIVRIISDDVFSNSTFITPILIGEIYQEKASYEDF